MPKSQLQHNCPNNLLKGLNCSANRFSSALGTEPFCGTGCQTSALFASNRAKSSKRRSVVICRYLFEGDRRIGARWHSRQYPYLDVGQFRLGLEPLKNRFRCLIRRSTTKNSIEEKEVASLILGTTFTPLWLLRSRPDQVHGECMRGDPPRPQFIKFTLKFQHKKRNRRPKLMLWNRRFIIED